MKNQKSDPKNVSSKKKQDIDGLKKGPKLKVAEKKLHKNWKNSLFSEDEDDFLDEPFSDIESEDNDSDRDDLNDEDQEYND
ncbi:MAG: hypothetical protein H0V01_00225 [Bacteroidetes bacterium]|nr:hypothetical protein [Bacteroidota bacterium]HET6244945.1 hypothetical protein [Bacteroidia bacterium]